MIDAPDPEVAISASIAHWRRLDELASFALERHGFGETDGGFGVTYPDDLDEWDREIDPQHIPIGSVLVYGFWGLPHGYELIVKESFYLEILALRLVENGFVDEASRLRSISSG